jgi:hypothetical protein
VLSLLDLGYQVNTAEADGQPWFMIMERVEELLELRELPLPPPQVVPPWVAPP